MSYMDIHAIIDEGPMGPVAAVKLIDQRHSVTIYERDYHGCGMFANFDRAMPEGPLWATPSKVAAGILKAIGKRKAVAYLPGFWWAIMMIIKNIPEFVFRRIKL